MQLTADSFVISTPMLLLTTDSFANSESMLLLTTDSFANSESMLLLTTDSFVISTPMSLLTTDSFSLSAPMLLLTTDSFRIFRAFYLTDNCQFFLNTAKRPLSNYERVGQPKITVKSLSRLLHFVSALRVTIIFVCPFWPL
jgi:hypothetical protein